MKNNETSLYGAGSSWGRHIRKCQPGSIHAATSQRVRLGGLDRSCPNRGYKWLREIHRMARVEFHLTSIFPEVFSLRRSLLSKAGIGQRH